MLSEEALILIAVVGACALLVLGIIELIWPSKPRHPVRRSQSQPAPPKQSPSKQPSPSKPPPAAKQPAPATRPAAAKPVAWPAPAVPAPQAAATQRRRRSKVSPHARPHAGSTVAGTSVARSASPPSTVGGPRQVPEGSDTAAEPAVAPAVQPEVAPAVAPTVAPAVEPAAAPLAGDAHLVETCFSLYQEKRYAEVVALGEEALAKARAKPPAEDGAHDTAALWSVVALARQALGDDEGARAALEAALAVCPAGERPTYRQHLAALALNAAQTWLARARSQETDDRVVALRSALVWVAHGLDAAPEDERLHEACATARQGLWPAYEQAAHKLLQRQEFEAARRLLQEALEEPELPASRGDEFRELLSGTFGGEIGQLTAQAIRSMQEEREAEALASLQRAEDLLAAVPDEALPPRRRDEVDQRLWWGYTRLGIRRVESGEYEAALEPLVHALRFAAIGPERQEETRAALVRALEGVVDVRALSVRQLADEGNRDEAVLRTEALRELLRSCLELGVSEDELSVAFARTRRLAEELGLEDRA